MVVSSELRQLAAAWLLPILQSAAVAHSHAQLVCWGQCQRWLWMLWLLRHMPAASWGHIRTVGSCTSFVTIVMKWTADKHVL